MFIHSVVTLIILNFLPYFLSLRPTTAHYLPDDDDHPLLIIVVVAVAGGEEENDVDATAGATVAEP